MNAPARQPAAPVRSIVADISVLYELSMAVGRSLDLRSNCEQFVHVLMARKNLSYAAVWLWHDQLTDTPLAKTVPEGTGRALLLAYASPQHRIDRTLLPETHPLVTLTRERGAWSVAAGQPGFEALIAERRIARQGAFGILPLGDLGLLKIYSMVRTAPFSEVELNQLRPVAAQLAISLASCLYHLRTLHEEQVREKRKMEAVATLAGGIAHDYNNIMQSIRGYAELLQERFEFTHPETAADLRQVIAQIDQATLLTQRLLAFGRRSLVIRETVDLNRLLARAAPKWHPIAGTAITLNLHPAPRPAMVRVDPGLIENALLALVENAVEAMPDGGRLDIQVAVFPYNAPGRPADLPPGNYHLLSVTDTGHGMDDAARAHLFEPFFTTKFFGAGLGLPAVFGIAKQHNGTVQVDSRPGHGTTFRLYLPALPAPLT
ncbi:MAG: ATP-binding protein [Lentisphaeria bacterium]